MARTKKPRSAASRRSLPRPEVFPAAPALRAAIPLEIPEPPASAGRLIVAYSGGLDSTVLLHLLAAREPARVLAVHVHHGLQAVADDWARHCERVCAEFGVAFVLRRVAVDPNGAAGPEGTAREARYAALRGAMQPGDCLVTAHHRDDQAETVLLRLLRGTGIDGLAAMRPLSLFGTGQLWRPLLDVPRARLRAHAEAHGLRWIDDPHNDDPRYARSQLRREVLPLLRARWPQADASLARTAALAAETGELLCELAEQDHQKIADGLALRVPALRALSAARRHLLLRHWLRGAGLPAPDAAALRRVDAEVLAAAGDAMPLLRWPGCELRRYRERLYAMPPLPAIDAGWSAEWREGVLIELPQGLGRLVANAPPPQPLRVRHPQPGERVRAAPGAPSRSLKNLFQEAGLPPWLRPRLPVIEQGGAVAWIPGVFLREDWRTAMRTANWRARWQQAPAGAPDLPDF